MHGVGEQRNRTAHRDDGHLQQGGDPEGDQADLHRPDYTFGAGRVLVAMEAAVTAQHGNPAGPRCATFRHEFTSLD